MDVDPVGANAPSAEELRRELGELFRELADRTEPALSRALETATRAWDQADVVTIMDDALRGRVEAVASRCRLAAGAPDTTVAASGMEGALALGAVVGLVALLERRLATLMRLRVGGGGELKEHGRPFLDVASALRDTARAWS